MTLLLGIDTGGTYTDAVLMDQPAGGEKGSIVAKAKALTTRHDLATGIGGAIRSVLEPSGIEVSDIGLVSISTTLATNALVEGQGSRVCLVSIGFQENDLERAGLRETLGNDPVIRLAGGHNTHGQQAAPLDTGPLAKRLEALSQEAAGFAVAGYFATRNPAHELAVRDLIAERTGLPVTCSHELSARLNGPKRALTTILNARLIPMISQLIDATRAILRASKIDAPLMVVRGDGALVSADFATRRPIETILSGPAASLVGAAWLSDVRTAIVSDIGGTTSDVALLDDGRPVLNPDGARVGGYRTMVEAVAMETFALGGDSEVGLSGARLAPHISLGPRRLVPVSLLAHEHGEAVHVHLDRQLKSTVSGRLDGRFAVRSGHGSQAGLSDGEKRLLAKFGRSPVPLDDTLQGASQIAVLDRLVARGLVLISGLTPSDAMHHLGRHDAWDREAATKALGLFARQKDGSGKPFAATPAELAERIRARVARRSAEVVLETAMDHDGLDGSSLVGHPLVVRAIETAGTPSPDGVVRFGLTLDRPLIALGASAHLYLDEAAGLAGTTCIVPEHADVANAIGAVAGQIDVRTSVSVLQPREGEFTVQGEDRVFASETDAFARAEVLASDRVNILARDAGAKDFEVELSRKTKTVEIESRPMFVEGSVLARATGRPPIA